MIQLTKIPDDATIWVDMDKVVYMEQREHANGTGYSRLHFANYYLSVEELPQVILRKYEAALYGPDWTDR